MWFVIKTLLSGMIIAFASSLAGKKPILAGFMIALPMMSLLSIIFSYLEFRDMQKINEFAASILVAVPLSLLFFVPFLLNRWLKMSFPVTYLSAIGCLAAGYFIHHFIFKTQLFR